MKLRHVPTRTCLGCRKKKPKHEMIRFTANGIAAYGRGGSGRGMYVCPDPACMEELRRRPDVRKRLGAAAYARVVRDLGAVTIEENSLDGGGPGSVICVKYHGGGAVG